MNKNTIMLWRENPWRIANSLARRGWLNGLSDKTYLSLMYRAAFLKKINWKNPRTFSEKLQWLKLNDRKDEYTRMVDKYEAKQFVADCIGKEYVVPVIGGPWENFEEIDFDKLPDQFVLKTTHDCGGVVICKDKQTFDIKSAKEILKKHLQYNYYLHCREWPYKNVQPRIFAEEYLSAESDGLGLKDYKFFTFNGEPKLMYIASGRDYARKEEQIVYADFFDMEFNHINLRIDHENSPICPSKPANFELMIECARKLAQGTKHLRVDFYEVDGCLYSGELTFFHCGGLHKFITEEWDSILGDWINI
ncbi:MAG: glycosyl transferase [Oscillospiraceae bacterium]|nr:glycosyl transferase [Oscillospiraceae bacterium]